MFGRPTNHQFIPMASVQIIPADSKHVCIVFVLLFSLLFFVFVEVEVSIIRRSIRFL